MINLCKLHKLQICVQISKNIFFKEKRQPTSVILMAFFLLEDLE